jgi:hypothetical protein
MFDLNLCLHRQRRSDRHPHGRRAGKVTESLKTSPWNSLVSMAHVLYSYFSRGHTHRGPPGLNEMYSIQITVSKYRHTQVEIHRAQSVRLCWSLRDSRHFGPFPSRPWAISIPFPILLSCQTYIVRFLVQGITSRLSLVALSSTSSAALPITSADITYIYTYESGGFQWRPPIFRSLIGITPSP